MWRKRRSLFARLLKRRFLSTVVVGKVLVLVESGVDILVSDVGESTEFFVVAVATREKISSNSDELIFNVDKVLLKFLNAVEKDSRGFTSVGCVRLLVGRELSTCVGDFEQTVDSFFEKFFFKIGATTEST
jgi:hypothetical protein